MLCCVGLFAGVAVGQTLGGPWTIVAPAAGFGIGFLADMKMMKGMHHQQPPAPPVPAPAAPQAAATAAEEALAGGELPARNAEPA